MLRCGHVNHLVSAKHQCKACCSSLYWISTSIQYDLVPYSAWVWAWHTLAQHLFNTRKHFFHEPNCSAVRASHRFHSVGLRHRFTKWRCQRIRMCCRCVFGRCILNIILHSFSGCVRWMRYSNYFLRTTTAHCRQQRWRWPNSARKQNSRE